MDEVVSYKCPNCAAPLAFDIESQGWDCNFCNSSFSLAQLEGPGKAGEAEPERVEVNEGQDYTYDDGVQAYTCPSCGGKIVTDQNTAATFCTFCHNPTVIASQLEREKRPEQLIPFKLEKEEAVKALQKHCHKRPLMPADFREYAEKGEINGLYVPFWLYSCDVDAHLRGQGINVSTWSDRNYRYTKTDTYHVERSATLSFQDVPADGSSKMDDQLMQGLEPFQYGQMVDFSMGYLSGHFAESYDVDSAQASVPAFSRIRSGVEARMRGQVQGYSSFRLQSLDSRNRNVRSRYVMLPVWTVMADYKGERYTFAMNGQTGKIVGRLPMSWARVAAWSGIVFAATFLLGVLGGVLLG